MRPIRQAIRGLAVLAVLTVAGALATTQARTASTEVTADAPLTWAQLPREGREVGALIARGGPFAHGKDGSVFGNRERLLPAQKRGYYREYTVPTPGLDHRGARRLVCGGLQVRTPDACYYSVDHYDSFRQVIGSLPQRSP